MFPFEAIVLKLIFRYYNTLAAGLHQVMQPELGGILRFTDNEILMFFIRCRSVAIQLLTICELLSKFLGGKSFYSRKLVISWSKPLKIDQIFNCEIFLIFEFWL